MTRPVPIGVRIMGMSFVVAGVVATFLALLGAKDDFVMWVRGRDVVGTILSIKVVRGSAGSRGHTWEAAIEVAQPGPGRRVVKLRDVVFQPLEKGDPVVLRYLPESPERLVLKRPLLEILGINAVLMMVGPALCVVGWCFVTGRGGTAIWGKDRDG